MAGPRLNAGARKLFDRIGIRPMAPGESSAERYTGQIFPQGVYGQAQTPRGQLSQSSMEKFIGPLSPLSGYGIGTPGMFRGAAPVHSPSPFLQPNAGQVGSPLMGGRLAGGAPSTFGQAPASYLAPSGDGRSPLTPDRYPIPGINLEPTTMEYEFGAGPFIEGGFKRPMGMARGGGALDNTASSYFAGQMPSVDPRESGLMQSLNRIGDVRANAQSALANAQQYGVNRQQNFDTRWDQYAQQAPMMNQYGANPSITPGQQYANQVASQVGYGPNGVDVGLAAQNNANRQFALTNSSMAQRFGPNSPLTAQGNANAALTQRERNGEGVMLQTGGYGSPLTFVPRNQNAGPVKPLQSTAQQAWDAGYADLALELDAETKEKGDRMRARQAERRAARGGLTERQARELKRDQRRQSQDLFERGISPNSPLGQAMAPALQPRTPGGPQSYTSPLTREDGSVVTPVPQGAPKDARSVQEAATAAHTMLQQVPIFKAMGFDPGQSPDEMPGYEAVADALALYAKNGQSVGDSDLDAIHQYAIQLQQADRLKKEEPGIFGSVFDRANPGATYRQDMFRQLGSIPAGDRQQLKQWWNRFNTPLTYGATGVSR